MSQDFQTEQNKIARASVNLVWLMVAAIAMLFAGLLSAYLVSKGDVYWVHISVPPAFWVSTISILLSSVTIFIAGKKIRDENSNFTMILLLATLLLSVVFIHYQYKGWIQLYQSGNPLSGSKIIDPENNLYLQGDFNGDEKEETLVLYIDYADGKLYSNIKTGKREVLNTSNVFQLPSNQLILKGKYLNSVSPLDNQLNLIFDNGFFYLETDKALEHPLNKYQLSYAGQYILQGEYGKDVWVSKNGKQLILENGKFYNDSDAGRLSPLNAKIAEYPNAASSYVNLIALLHLLHIVFAVLFLLITIVKVMKHGNSFKNQYWMKGMNVIWHFLGGLWLFLFIFLFFYN